MTDHIPIKRLRKMSRCTQKAAICRWLDEKGVAYHMNRDGEPVTTWTAYNASLLERKERVVGF